MKEKPRGFSRNTFPHSSPSLLVSRSSTTPLTGVHVPFQSLSYVFGLARDPLSLCGESSYESGMNLSQREGHLLLPFRP